MRFSLPPPKRLSKSTEAIGTSLLSKRLARETCMAKAPAPKRGEIWLVDFDPSLGAEIRKARPAVVVSLDSIGRLPLRVVVPVTDWKTQYAAAAIALCVGAP
jgi:hypothetical protein